MNRWDFNLRKYNDNNEKLTEPFGYNFEDDVRAAYGNGDSYLKTEKNINCLNKLNKNENNKSNISVYSEKILEKKAWGVCLNAFKGLIMNIFVMYMSGGASGIFGIIFIIYSIYNILKSLLNINDAFKSVESNTNQSFWLQKVCFALINFLVLLYIMNVCSNSGLLPIRSADYFYFLPHQKVKQKVMGNLF
ncbi:ER membrane protein complex subunit 4 [Plasmodium brasilianum]|uniref:ER membrane protein complex subunit 4 n=2 Tax=Plasmodium (Plasmodium) TaxID=418103 RepID=A0A1A8WBJ2_PLAMA|nr:ER membrane protein complex subunit 4, putative [Plasmodium malariae]KAI4835673.1 ER membrane protein complex subunit 4 [Plasmodium brasilianum]SBS89371.1 ER membrane protein complex subunit 4, putative [Plasmodium malariae]SCP02602.1 ER membrane protein complex subunit 4, putative [Plasmodium malariae]